METFWTYFEVLAPSVGVGLVFWLAIRSIFRADRSERSAEARIRDEALSRADEDSDGGDRQDSDDSAESVSSEGSTPR